MSFKEEDHPRDNDGKFTEKPETRAKINDFKNSLRSKVVPSKEFQKNQQEVDKEVTVNVWKAIDDLGIRDKIHDVAMQGSYEKGTDLPASGSDLDLFVVFKTNIPEAERQELGVKIGMSALAGKNPYIQTATTQYAEAFFEHNGQKMEVQVVPTRHLTLEQIRTKSIDGKPIKSIGMERTPHQTAFMKEALKGKESEVRMLKQFMKDTGLYDSSMKSQGFSGYSAEVLIHNFDTFENTLKFFKDFKKGSVVGMGEGSKNNAFSLMDPIDPNRDLISAFSDVKIGRTIKTAKYFLENGEPPKKSEPAEMKSVTVSFDNTQGNEDTLVGQSRKSQKAIINQLNKMGFNIEVKNEKITDDFEVEVPRSKMNEDEGKVSLTFGIDDYNIPKEFPRIIDPKKANIDTMKAKGIRIEPFGTMARAWYKRDITNIADALEKLTTSNLTKSGLSTGTVDDMKNGISISTKDKDQFENLI
jgi:tRNA CCA-adding enzyme